MIHLGLGQDKHQELIETLSGSHLIQISVDVLDHNEKHRDTLTWPEARVVDGEIQVDLTADVTRSCSLTLLDPNHKLSFDPKSPSQGALYAGYFINVKYGVWLPDSLEWVEIPVFYGPLTSYEQTNETVQLEAQGKEALLLDPHFTMQGYTIRAGMRLDDAIKKVAEKAGETHFDLPDLDKRLPEHRVITPKMEPWNVIQGGTKTAWTQRQWTSYGNKDKKKDKFTPKLIGGDLLSVGDVDRYAFYDGHGRLCVRKHHETPQFTFDDGWLTESPSVSYNLEGFVNYVYVKGTKGKGAKKTPYAWAVLPDNHPLSGVSLGRNGTPRYITMEVETALTTTEDCFNRAQQILHQHARTGVNASFVCLPMPLMEEGDRIRLATNDYDFDFVLKQWSLPLTSASGMAIGMNRRTLPRYKKRKWDHQFTEVNPSKDKQKGRTRVFVPGYNRRHNPLYGPHRGRRKSRSS